MQEKQILINQQAAVAEQEASLAELAVDLDGCRILIAEAEAQIHQRTELEAELNLARQQQAEARAENPRLKDEMDTLKSRIDQLSLPVLSADESLKVKEAPRKEYLPAEKELQDKFAVCPLCGQPLTPADRERLVADLNRKGKELGDRYRYNQALLKESEQRVQALERQIAALSSAEAQRLEKSEMLARLEARQESILAAMEEWQRTGYPRLAEVQAILEAGTYALEARQRLAEVDAELKALGYDASAHDQVRLKVTEGQPFENEFRRLEIAQAALVPLERELSELKPQIARQAELLAEAQRQHASAVERWEAARAGAPDLDAAEIALLNLQEQENRLRLEVGAAQQKVLVLDDLRQRRRELSVRREELARQIARYRQLDRAMGKDGVPALLIEQALPQIEAKANDLLERLSGGVMSVRFQTQSQYKDKRREDLKETLDILISDSAGYRDYELYSGGEAFRVNFAIRLALSEVLAQRAGARLQTLVIDEGFGSQDALGRQRLVEAINAVRPDFAKILVITHIDELKDAFPTRIEVEKTSKGSTVRVI
jgi:exonuclease SbcC